MARVHIAGPASGPDLMAARPLPHDGRDVTLPARPDHRADDTHRAGNIRRAGNIHQAERTDLGDALLEERARLTGTPLPSR
jgi:hypothetical protein